MHPAEDFPSLQSATVNNNNKTVVSAMQRGDRLPQVSTLNRNLVHNLRPRYLKTAINRLIVGGAAV